MSEHTKAPWAIHDNGSFFDIGVPYGGVLGVYPTVMIGVEHCNEANARHIVKAVNYHDRLVEALRKLESGYGYCNYPSEEERLSDPDVAEARTILQELEG